MHVESQRSVILSNPDSVSSSRENYHPFEIGNALRCFVRKRRHRFFKASVAR